MTMTYGAQPIFGTGPARVLVGPAGAELRRRAEVTAAPKDAGTAVIGGLEKTVIVRGRLVGATHALVEAQRSTLESSAKPEGPPAKLIDAFGRVWSDMLLVRVSFGAGPHGRGPVEGFEVGRDVSLSYECEFRRVSQQLGA